ncbi:unnamed protein product [Scytosiphon promiscuus]
MLVPSTFPNAAKREATTLKLWKSTRSRRDVHPTALVAKNRAKLPPTPPNAQLRKREKNRMHRIRCSPPMTYAMKATERRFGRATHKNIPVQYFEVLGTIFYPICALTTFPLLVMCISTSLRWALACSLFFLSRKPFRPKGSQPITVFLRVPPLLRAPPAATLASSSLSA